MSSAIQAGAAFVRFYGDLSDLQKSFKQIENQVNRIAGATKTSLGGTMNAAAAKATGGLSATNKVVLDIGGTIGAALQPLLRFVSNLSNLSRTAAIASWGLRGTSIIMKMMGKDASQLEPWIKNLNRVSWGIFAVNMATKAARASWLAFKTVAMSPITIPMAGFRALGRMIPHGGRGGGAAGNAVSGIVQGASATDEDGKVSAGSAAGSGALTGLMMGGIVGAAGGAAFGFLGAKLSSALTDGAKAGAKDSESIITRLGYKVNAVFQWVGKQAGDIWNYATSKFKQFGGEGESILTKLEKAIYPIVHAVENVWIPAMMNGIDFVAGLFAVRTDEMGGSWSDFFVDAVGMVADFIANFDIYFQIAQQTLVMWAGNGIVLVQDFFRNFGKLMVWAGSNWKNILFTMLDYGLTIFINLGENIRTLFEKIWNWVKSGFTGALDLKKEDFKGLTEGARSAISDMPKIFETELAKTTPEIDALYGRLKERQDAAKEGLKEFEGLNFDAKSEDKKAGQYRGFNAISAQSQEAAELIAKAASGTKKNETAEKQKETNGLLKQVKSVLEKGFDKIGGNPSSVPAVEIPR